MNEKTQPDSLQDLCVFYCINNLEYLVNSLQSWKSTCSDVPSPFSTVLCDKILDNYLTCHIPNTNTQSLVDELFQNSLLCNSLSLKRREMLTAENLKAFAHNSFKYLDIVFFKGERNLRPGLKDLIANNSKTLISINIWNRAKESACMELFENISCWKVDIKSERQCEAGDTVQNVDINVMPANTKFSTKEFVTFARNLPPSDTCGNSVTAVKNLRSFSYIKHYNDIEGVESYVSHHIVKIMKQNKDLQSVTIVSPISHPSVVYLALPELHSLCNLRSLVLSNDAIRKDLALAPESEELFENLPKLKHLQHLDLSFGVTPRSRTYEEQYMMKYDTTSKESFKKALIQMTWLRSLDISGTNLTELICHTNPEEAQKCEHHCMPGFEGRQFDYLGLSCSNACCHEGIPAKKVSGHWSEEQLLVALWSHWHNKVIMYHVLQELLIFIKATQSNIKHNTRILEGLIAYMEYVPDWGFNGAVTEKNTVLMDLKTVENILVSIYYLLRFKLFKHECTVRQGRRLLDVLIVIFSNCARDMTLIFGEAKNIMTQVSRVAMLLVLSLDLEKLTVYSFCFERYMGVLMNLMETSTGHEHLMLVFRMMHSAIRLSQDLKVVAGKKLRLMQVLLSRISFILENYGNTIELGKMWSIIWTLTDEVPVNCELFIAHGGCDIGVSSIKAYQDDDDLQRKVSGAMCNVSEVAHLRPLLMTQPLIQLFGDLLNVFTTDNYDVTSHAAAYLVLLAADGAQAWTLEDPSRDSILEAIDSVIRDRWDIMKPKGVKFRSLTPMMKQLDNFSTPTAQYWGAWMICNLVIVKPDMYCAMVEEESGLEVIDTTLQNEELRSDVRELLIKIRSITMDYRREKDTQVNEAN